MDGIAPFAFKKNLERVEEEVSCGLWQVGGYVDLFSERKFLLFHLKSGDLSNVRAGVLAFRTSSAAALEPRHVSSIIDLNHKNDRLEILTPYCQRIDLRDWDDLSLSSALETIVATLIRFEKHRFYACGVSHETFCRGEDGTILMMPPAFVVPRVLGKPRSTTATKVSAAPADCSHPDIHVSAMGDLLRALIRPLEPQTPDRATPEGGDLTFHTALSPFRERLAKAATAIVAGEIRSLQQLSARLFDENERGVGTPVSVPAGFPGEPYVSAVETAAIPGSVVRIEGGDAALRSQILQRVGKRIARRDNTTVERVDDWVLAVPGRKRAAREGDSATKVWVFDDVGNAVFLYSALLDRIAENDALVYSIGPSSTPSLDVFLNLLKNRAGEKHRVVSIDGTVPVDSQAEPEAVAGMLEALTAEQRQIVELLAVARFPVPYEIVQSVFSTGGAELHAWLHELAALDLLEIQYRALPPSNLLTIVLKPLCATTRGRIYESISSERRSNLHRTVARMSETHGSVPTILVFDHLLKGGGLAGAAKCAIAFLKETPREKRAPFLDTMIAELIEGRLYEQLPFGDQLFAFHELAADLYTAGRRAEAEKMLVEAREIADDADPDQVHQSAAAVAEILGLLADTWAARGNYSRALSLLISVKESLNPYLSLPAQARLLNDIAWLQYRLGDYENALESCKLTLNTLNPNEHPLVVAQALNVMGVIHFNTSRYDEAISYYEQSSFLREKERDVNALSASFNNLALAYQTKGEYDKALSYYNRSLEIKKLQNNQVGIAAGYLNLALLYLEIHNFEEAEKKCRESLDISASLGNTRLMAENYSTLGDIEFTREHFDPAEKHYRESLAIAHSLETINEEMGAHRRLAKLYLTKKKYREARKSVKEASTIAKQIGSRYENAQIDEIVADLNVEENRFDDAIQYYEMAASSYAAVARPRLVAPILAKIGLVHAKRGNAFEATQYLDRALDLVRSEIGHEIPDEVVTLQQALRERPVKSSPTGTDSQKLLYAFYELSSLTEYADDRSAFFKRVIGVLRDLTGSSSCFIALQTQDNEFVIVGAAGEHEPLTDMGLRALSTRSLQLGGLLDSASKEVADLVPQIKVPPDCGFRCVPMRAMGRNLGCLLMHVPSGTLPTGKDDSNFLTSIGRHIAGDIRLMLHLEEHAHKEETLEKQYDSLKAQVVDQYRFENLIGKDESMKKVFRTLERVKDMDTGLLVIGESGTGKTELARTIHYTSPRRKRLFQQLHCAEIPINLLESELFGHEKGAFTGAVQRKLGRCEVADGGTIFLDDVNVMPSETQTKLLHYLESKSFTRLGGTKKITTDVRIIAASNQDLEALVKEGKFREDLYYRLKVILIDLPPLRERREDLIAIAVAFLKKRCQAQGKPLKTLSAETIKLLQRYPWPGNVRELQNVLEQVVLLSDDNIIEPSSLPEDFLRKATGTSKHNLQSLESLAEQMVESGSYSEANPLMPQLEALLASKMTKHVDGKSKAAHLLGITKPTLYTRLRGYDKMQ